MCVCVCVCVLFRSRSHSRDRHARSSRRSHRSNHHRSERHERDRDRDRDRERERERERDRVSESHHLHFVSMRTLCSENPIYSVSFPVACNDVYTRCKQVSVCVYFHCVRAVLFLCREEGKKDLGERGVRYGVKCLYMAVYVCVGRGGIEVPVEIVRKTGAPLVVVAALETGRQRRHLPERNYPAHTLPLDTSSHPPQPHQFSHPHLTTGTIIMYISLLKLFVNTISVPYVYSL